MNDSYIRKIAVRIKSLIKPSALPKTGIDELFDIYAVLALAKGTFVTNEDIHNAWSAWATLYDPSNVSVVPFNDLPKDIRDEDSHFTDAIRSVAKELGEEKVS